MRHDAYIKGLDNQKTTVVASVYIPDLGFEKVFVMDDRKVTIEGKEIDFPNYKGHFCAEFIAAMMAVKAVNDGDDIRLYTNNKTCIQMYGNNNDSELFGFFIQLLRQKANEKNVSLSWIHVLKDSDSHTRYANTIAKKVMPYD